LSQEDLDLIVPRPGYQVDNLTGWVAWHFEPFHKYFSSTFSQSSRCLGEKRATTDAEKLQKLPSSTYGYDFNPQNPDEHQQLSISEYSKMIVKVKSVVKTLAACLVPTAAIAVLASVHRTAELIGFIGLFTLLFAVGLIIFASKTPTMAEIFTATAA
jgi:hypothetical protein